MLKQLKPGLFESELTGTLLEEMSVEHDGDLEIRWLVNRQTGSINLFLLQPAAVPSDASGSFQAVA
jgi:hypothetical protein